MKEDKALEERLKLLEMEISTVAAEAEKSAKLLEEIAEIKKELGALKLFISRRHAEFKKEFLDIVAKLKTG